MILKNSLYTIKSAKVFGAEASYDIELNAGHFIYQAHFPGEPITPGVCIVQIAMELLEEVVGKRLQLAKVKNVKFLSVVTPTQSTAVTFQLVKIVENEAEGTVKAQAVVTSEGEVKAKLSFICTCSQK